jgi:2-furoate---CoA ligase
MNLALTLLYAAERDADREAVVDGATRLTYTGLLDRASRLAGGLAELGVGRGDRVAALLKNRVETVTLYWAAQWLGACFVPLNFRLSSEEVAYCVRDAGAAVVVFEDVSAPAAGELRGDHTLVDVDSLPRGDPHPGALDLDDGEPSLMLYTSGTTGRPKGVPRSHRADRAAGLSQIAHHGLLPHDRTLGVMPLYHTMGMHSLIAMALLGGCFVVQVDWDADEALGLISRASLSSLYLAPTLFHDLLERSPRDLCVRSVGYAGAPMSPALAERCAQAFQPEVFFNHYGSTEIYTWSIHRDQAAKPGCAGRPALNARLRLVRPDADAEPDEVVAPGEDGQVICHGSSDEAFRGYWRRPDADERAFHDGWYYPGDLGRIDEDGDLWIVGRLDDMIITGGENVHPVEVENALAGFDGVEEVAVVGEPDERWGQRVVAYVVTSGDVTGEQLDQHCRSSSSLAAFKRPREFRFVDELPKTAAGKILRRELREEH